MDKNFKVRVAVGLTMFVIAIVGLYTFDAIPFKIIYALFSLVAAVELLSFLKKKHTGSHIFLILSELFFLITAVIFVTRIDVNHFWYIILGVPGYDIFAYLYGKLCGGKLFKKSRPFPKVSKNKTWEGTILGLLSAIALVSVKMGLQGAFSADWIFLFCGPLALMGDLFESYLKRHFKVKDSNEIIIKNKFYSGLEMLVGGSEGHGGFLDRIDSTAFACTIILILSIIINKGF
ncbi:phosphatidate cytidylyltransferase [Candidatus Saccharibacteria bacterium]|nr:phosphatidate cytidylyltransferase [Candidatus Saccharibacteria bacterium]